MRGDELGKLHNIFIRYNFTRLVDGLQGDTLKTNAECRSEKKREEKKEVWLTLRCVDEGRTDQNRETHDVFCLHESDSVT